VCSAAIRGWSVESLSTIFCRVCIATLAAPNRVLECVDLSLPLPIARAIKAGNVLAVERQSSNSPLPIGVRSRDFLPAPPARLPRWDQLRSEGPHDFETILAAKLVQFSGESLLHHYRGTLAQCHQFGQWWARAKTIWLWQTLFVRDFPSDCRAYRRGRWQGFWHVEPSRNLPLAVTRGVVFRKRHMSLAPRHVASASVCAISYFSSLR
jgi:hypothetical protein